METAFYCVRELKLLNHTYSSDFLRMIDHVCAFEIIYKSCNTKKDLKIRIIEISSIAQLDNLSFTNKTEISYSFSDSS